MRGRGVVDHGQRGLERMGEIPRMSARLFGLPLRMGEQCVDLLDQLSTLTVEAAAMARVPLAGTTWIPGNEIRDRPGSGPTLD